MNPLISFETWQTIKKRMSSQGHAPARKDLKEDFPLRGFVSCAGVAGNLVNRSLESKGRSNARFPYYLCYNKSCSEYRRNQYAKKKIEAEFEEATFKPQALTEPLIT